MPRASYYRRLHRLHRLHRLRRLTTIIDRRHSPRRLSDCERRQVLDVLTDERFVDLAPAQVYGTLLDEGRYLCSLRTMYRVLDENQLVRERRDQLRHPAYAAPELLATGPNQLWSWDITKLLGPAKWTYFYLYVSSMSSVAMWSAGWWRIASRHAGRAAHR